MASVKTANSEFRARSSTQADNTFGQVPNILGVSETIEALGRYEWTVVQSMLWHQHGHGKISGHCGQAIWCAPSQTLTCYDYPEFIYYKFTICRRPHDISPHLTPIQIHINFIPTPFITRLPLEPPASTASAKPDWAYLASPHLGTPWPKERRTNGWICFIPSQPNGFHSEIAAWSPKRPLFTPQHMLWVMYEAYLGPQQYWDAWVQNMKNSPIWK